MFLWQCSNMELRYGQALYFLHFRAQKNFKKIYLVRNGFLTIFVEKFDNPSGKFHDFCEKV